jgi:hypothetical protein
MKRIPALGEEVKRVHVGRPDDAEHVGHALCDQRFDKGFGRRHARLALGDTTVDFRSGGCAALAVGAGFFFVAFVMADLCGEVIWNGGSLRVAGIQA